MSVPRKLASLTLADDHPRSRKAMVRFLTTIWTCHPEDAVTFLATRNGSSWLEHPIVGDRASAINSILDRFPNDECDIYFCPNAFDRKERKTEYALRTPYAWCDIDEDRPAAFKPHPNILWETSEGRFQGLWTWRETLVPTNAEKISRWLLKFGGDKGGWSVTKLLRVPGTINHKRERNRDRVRLLRMDSRQERLPIAPSLIDDPVRPPVSTRALNSSLYDAKEVKRRYRRAVGLVAGTLMTATRVMRSDRSGAVFLIVSAMIGAGANDDEIACVLLDNPYFTSKWGDDVGEAERQISRIRAQKEAGR